MTPITGGAESFDRGVAFSRNLGLVSPSDAEILARSRVAIAGLGGVGGAHLEVLARQGIGGFSLADPDTFEQANTNRQLGSTLSTWGMNKADVSARRAQDINPTVSLTVLKEGVTPDNIDTFLRGADVLMDALDAFEINTRRLLYQTAQARGIPVVAAGPLGFGATLLVFTPEGMSFDRYYDLNDGLDQDEQFARFIVGTSPRAFHLAYLDLSYVNLKERRGPSSSIGVTLCAAAAATEVLRLLLRWGNVRPAPFYAQYDLRRKKWHEGRLLGGNRNLFQRFKLAILRRRLTQPKPVQNGSERKPDRRGRYEIPF